MSILPPVPPSSPTAARNPGRPSEVIPTGDSHGDQTLPRIRRSARFARLIVTAALAVKIAALCLWIWTPWRVVPVLVFFGGGLLVVYHLLAPSASGVCAVFTRFQTEKAEVWLTIDDGPDPEDTPRLLDLFDRHRARATFFVIGRRAAEHPHLIREILRRGHSIGHHTQTHPEATFWCASRRRVQRELDDALAVLHGLGAQPQFFRAPVGIKNLALASELQRRSLVYVGWSMRSGDCLLDDPAQVASRVLKHARPGAILLVHEGPGVHAEVRVQAIEQIVTGLAQRGLTCVIPDRSQLV